MMLYLSWQLTILVLVMLAVIFLIVKKVGGRSANYFIKQQRALSQVNGFIEEHIEGQRVIKVFCHEPQTKQEFAELNEQWRDAGRKCADLWRRDGTHHGEPFACPLCCDRGGWRGIGNWRCFGSWYNRIVFTVYEKLSNPVTQISQQFNNILSALAGAERIFALIDVAPESDKGDVVLVNMENTSEGTMRETGRPYWPLGVEGTARRRRV